MAAWKIKRKWFWQRQKALWDAALTLAVWRWRTQGFLLSITGLGVTVAVVLIVSLPLFSSVMVTAGLRGVLRAQSASSQVVVNAHLAGLSSSLVADATSQVNDTASQDAGSYLTGQPQSTLITANWLSPGPLSVDFYGVSLQQARSHLKLLQGHIPVGDNSSATDIDILLTKTAALYLGHYQVGDTFTLNTSLLPGYQDYRDTFESIVHVHLIGIFQVQPDDAFWNGYTLEEPAPTSFAPSPPVLALSDYTAVLHMFDEINQQHHGTDLYFQGERTSELLLSYYVNSSIMIGSQLEDLIGRLGIFQQDISQNFQSDSIYGGDGNIVNASLTGPPVHDPQLGDSILEKYQAQVQIIQTPALILTAQILCLILFFIAVMVGALVERDQVAIAVLRSRGANRRQVSGSLVMQGLILCLLAGILGPILALLLTYLILPLVLTPETRDALNALTLDVGGTLRTLGLSTLAAIVAAFATLMLTIFLAMQANILTRRREDARATHMPLWQRLRMDLAVAVLAVTGYITTYYLESSQTLLSLQSQTLISTPLELLAPLLLLLAGIIFFLRFFPLLLRFLARVALRRRGLISMLALAQMERAPRQSMRMALLLGLATAFTLFALVFSASQGQRAQDLATYQAVSDFSGYSYDLPATSLRSSTSLNSTSASVLANARSAVSQATDHYQQIQGVTISSIGSMNSVYLPLNVGSGNAHGWETRLIAVDPVTYGRVALWSAQDSPTPLADLMKLLIEQRPQALQHGIVPALVASNTWQQLGLSQGATFHLGDESGHMSPTTYLALAEINHIPPVDDGSEGAILVDYQSLVAGQLQGQGMTQVTAIAQLNYVWLRSSDSPAALSHVRAALNSPEFALRQFMDRRALSGGNASDPLASSLISTMSIGVAATLLLAFLANLLLPLLSVRLRQTNFAVLRALGTAPAQVTGILLWELAIVLATALVLGVLFGGILTFTSVPPLVFTGALPASLVSVSSSTIYTLQQIIPVRIVMPLSLLIALLLLLLLCVLALWLMSRLVQRPLMAQALRLNED